MSKELFFDIFFGLIKGISAPPFMAILAIFLLSVLTIILLISLIFFAVSIG